MEVAHYDREQGSDRDRDAGDRHAAGRAAGNRDADKDYRAGDGARLCAGCRIAVCWIAGSRVENRMSQREQIADSSVSASASVLHDGHANARRSSLPSRYGAPAVMSS